MVVSVIDPAFFIVVGCLIASLVSLAISVVAIFVAVSARKN